VSVLWQSSLWRPASNDLSTLESMQNAAGLHSILKRQ
jgi:hypothetical protein